MLKAVFRPNELVNLTEKIVIDTNSAYSDFPNLNQDDAAEEVEAVEEYTGPTASELRHEAEMFLIQWEEEKERMIVNAKMEAESIIQEAQKAASAEVKRQTDEAQALKLKAQTESERIIADANIKAVEIENEIRQTIGAEKKEAIEKGREEGRAEGFTEGKSEVDRLIRRTQVVLERAQNKRGEILSETEQEIVDLVLLITRKVIKVISNNQRNVIVSNVIEALRKVKAKGNVIIRVNLADLNLATEHKQEFIKVMEGAKTVQIAEDSTVDNGGCIIETDFGEIDARISSQLAELESKILEISPIRSSIKENLPPPVVRTANLNADLAATSAMLEASQTDNIPAAAEALSPSSALAALSAMGKKNKKETDESEERELSPAANAALTASAALAALATMGAKGRRETDKNLVIT
jgi:flagellar assembly protein FliH